MQKSVIFFKQSLPEKVVTLLVSIANEAFNNREGQITGIRESSHCLSFGGDENLYGCLQLGMLELEDNKEFLMCVRDWMQVGKMRKTQKRTPPFKKLLLLLYSRAGTGRNPLSHGLSP